MTEPIIVLTTGGTIDKQYFDALSTYKIVDSTVARSLRIARVTHPHVVVECMRKDSLEMTPLDRAEVARRVLEARSRCIVITHGTDTMTQTAAALTETGGKTIVFTGALAPARFSESDAAFNLGMAFAAAQTLGPGVYIAMNGSIFPAADVEKDRELGAFVPRRAVQAE